jgi:hypothetical protein
MLSPENSLHWVWDTYDCQKLNDSQVFLFTACVDMPHLDANPPSEQVTDRLDRIKRQLDRMLWSKATRKPDGCICMYFIEYHLDDELALTVSRFLPRSRTQELDRSPCKVGVAVTDIATALYAHGAIMAAVISRQQTGKGVWINCNLFFHNDAESFGESLRSLPPRSSS